MAKQLFMFLMQPVQAAWVAQGIKVLGYIIPRMGLELAFRLEEAQTEQVEWNIAEEVGEAEMNYWGCRDATCRLIYVWVYIK